jgi:hypothetical protein
VVNQRAIPTSPKCSCPRSAIRTVRPLGCPPRQAPRVSSRARAAPRRWGQPEPCRWPGLVPANVAWRATKGTFRGSKPAQASPWRVGPHQIHPEPSVDRDETRDRGRGEGYGRGKIGEFVALEEPFASPPRGCAPGVGRAEHFGEQVFGTQDCLEPHPGRESKRAPLPAPARDRMAQTVRRYVRRYSGSSRPGRPGR